MLKHIFYIGTILILCSCSKNEPTYTPTREDLIGKKFTSSVVYVEFISSDSLVWLIDKYRDTPILYRERYELNGNNIKIEVKDTIRVDYNNPITGAHRYITTYHSDYFTGTFKNSNTINASMIHTHEMWEDDLYIIGSGVATTNFDLNYLK